MARNKINFITGETYTLAELFSENRRVVIPDLQRDYCWGDEGDLVSDFIRNLIEQFELDDPTDLNMGMFYGYEIPANHIQLCDGQQRLTTLFLLLGMLNKTVGKFRRHLISDFEYKHDDREPYLNYSIRESSLYFLSDLVCEFFIENIDEVESIKNADWYFNDYNNDPSIRSMISAMKIIEKLLADKDVEWQNAFGEWLLHKLTFLYFDMENRANGEETFVVINTTGEPLSATQNLKPLVINAEVNKDNGCRCEIWEKIETWFWTKRSGDNDTADAGFAEFLRWVWMIEKKDEKLSKDLIGEDESRMRYSIQPILKGSAQFEFPYKEISVSTIDEYWKALCWITGEDSPFKFPEYYLSPSYDSKTGKSMLEQNECYVILPVLMYVHQNLSIIDPHADDVFKRKVKRVYEFFNNTIRLSNVYKAVNDLVREALNIVEKLKDDDIVSVLDFKDNVSSAICSTEENEKLEILRDNDGGDREEIENLFWALQGKQMWDGSIAPVIQWVKEGGVFALNKLSRYYNVLNEVFGEIEKDKHCAVAMLMRRCMILLDKGYKPVERGSYLSFGWEVSDWSELLRNSGGMVELLDYLAAGKGTVAVKLENFINSKLAVLPSDWNDYMEFAKSNLLLSFTAASKACDIIKGLNDWQIAVTGGVGRHTGFISSKNAYIYNNFTCCDYDGKVHLLPSPVWSVWCWGAAHNTNCVVFHNINGLKLDVRYLSKKDGSGTLQVETKPVNENISEHMEYFNKVVSTLMIPTLYEKDMPSFDLPDIHAEVQQMMDNIDSVK